jgi:hypothetical protein
MSAAPGTPALSLRAASALSSGHHPCDGARCFALVVPGKRRRSWPRAEPVARRFSSRCATRPERPVLLPTASTRPPQNNLRHRSAYGQEQFTVRRIDRARGTTPRGASAGDSNCACAELRATRPLIWVPCCTGVVNMSKIDAAEARTVALYWDFENKGTSLLRSASHLGRIHPVTLAKRLDEAAATGVACIAGDMFDPYAAALELGHRQP